MFITTFVQQNTFDTAKNRKSKKLEKSARGTSPLKFKQLPIFFRLICIIATLEYCLRNTGTVSACCCDCCCGGGFGLGGLNSLGALGALSGLGLTSGLGFAGLGGLGGLGGGGLCPAGLAVPGVGAGLGLGQSIPGINVPPVTGRRKRSPTKEINDSSKHSTGNEENLPAESPLVIEPNNDNVNEQRMKRCTCNLAQAMC